VAAVGKWTKKLADKAEKIVLGDTTDKTGSVSDALKKAAEKKDK
jgi:hypothetical protein